MAHEHVYNGGRICEICGNSFGKPNTPKDGQMPDTNIYELNDEYQRKVFKSKYGYEMPNTDKQNSPNRLHSAQDVNKTDSQDLMSELVGEFLRFSIDLDAETSAKRVLDITTAYTANKQRQLLEWVDKNVVGADETGKPIALAPHVTRNYLRAAQREQLKNKKESLGEG